MSKGNMMLGYARGKVGSLVFARRKGEQITRAYNSNPANPKSTAQMLQRMKWANLVAFYRAVSPKLKMAFESKPENQSDFNAFMSANLGNMQDVVYLTKPQVLNGASVIAPYTISKGSLPSIPFVYAAGSAGLRPIRFEVNINVTDEDTPEQALATMQNANIDLDLQYGDQLTLFRFVQRTKEDGTPYVDVQAFKSVLGIDDGGTILNDGIGAFSQVSYIEISNNPNESGLVLGGAMIHSRVQNGKLMTSDATVVVNALPAYVYSKLNLQPFEAAARSYGWTEQAYLNPSDEIALAAAAPADDESTEEEGGE